MTHLAIEFDSAKADHGLRAGETWSALVRLSLLVGGSNRPVADVRERLLSTKKAAIRDGQFPVGSRFFNLRLTCLSRAWSRSNIVTSLGTSVRKCQQK